MPIVFIDHLAHQGRRHTYRCRQVVRCGVDGIEHVRHVDLPGEREALAQFLAAVGLGRG